ncbi:MAG: methyltransferase domain-containing protein [Bacteroidetes bacterium]|jgi:SAM-dependent methyltransferase|nr:methyltransferase domain-containing protein [Bacteroidota bacterium]MBK7040854.1 methyltransferase domain-containing protein [Bacteroidota bacterium]MBK9299185.1 methyltransferase domain-containing protein [Bacteroidota bacterium]
MKKKCPLCKSDNIEYLLNVEVPTLQNRVYKTKAEANNCLVGNVNLTHCTNCNFTFNADFNENIIIYDENYDNAVPSKIFTEYYQTICKYIYVKYKLSNGTVYDIGCGKGTFLKMLCNIYPDVKGVGIDPSYEGELNPLNNLQFIQDFFNPSQVTSKPNLIISRHVFEHIEYPIDFLEIIKNPLKEFKEVPIFIEVPDFRWIVENKTFWDICYEHCNYFSEYSINSMFNFPWLSLESITKAFGNQYLWIEGLINSNNKDINAGEYFKIDIKLINDFVNSIFEFKNNIKNIILEYKKQNYKIIVWGMATKGVIFSINIDRKCDLIDFCIDINKDKQNMYSPITAHLIESPEILSNIYANCLIIVMNTNYLNEIQNMLLNFQLNAHFIDAHGNNL